MLPTLCDKSDIVFTEEHWLYEDELDIMNNINPNFVFSVLLLCLTATLVPFEEADSMEECTKFYSSVRPSVRPCLRWRLTHNAEI